MTQGADSESLVIGQLPSQQPAGRELSDDLESCDRKSIEIPVFSKIVRVKVSVNFSY